jgi:hypothetical protein
MLRAPFVVGTAASGAKPPFNKALGLPLQVRAAHCFAIADGRIAGLAAI